ncbi:MAG: preprotein translocase subunit SecY [archaeon]
MNLGYFIRNLPEVKAPAEKKLGFNTKIKWTLIILVSYFILENLPLFGLASNSLARFEYLAIIFGTSFGSIISLGIGPIVMASIILQLLVGSKILNIDMTTHEGKQYFQGLQKLLVFFFVVFEAAVYVLMRGLEANPGLEGLVILQLTIGGLLIVFMDEVTTKWGLGSGVSLFIAAGVGRRLFAQAFGFLGTQGELMPVGRVLVFFTSISAGDVTSAIRAGAAVVVTVLLFLIVVWMQSLKVEVPLSFGRLRGFGMRWPLAFFYTSVIPVILAAAMISNIQLFARLAQNAAEACINGGTCGIGSMIASKLTWLGTFSQQGQALSGLSLWLTSPNILDSIITGSFMPRYLLQALVHTLFFMFFSTIFAVFWVRTSGMDAKNQANQILASGLQIPGFRKDERVLESILSRYIMPLTVMGGAAIGLLSALSDLLGTLVSGTAVLLLVMIIYKLYEDISKQHALDMNPAMRKMFG